MSLKALLLGSLLLASAGLQAAPTEIRVVPSNRAAELLPILSPLVGPDGSVSAYQGQLIIKATPEKQRELESLLKQLDRPLRNVMISVRRTGSESSSERGINTDARISYPGNSRIRIGVKDNNQTRNDNSVHSSRTLENTATLIDTGEAIPVPVISHGPGGTTIGSSYQDVMRGFEATPQILPDGRVRLEIRYRYENAQARSRVINSQSADSVLMVSPGQWQSMGGVSESSSSTQSGILSRETRQSQRELPLEVKVDILD